jgi:hypothetical protein
VFVIRLVPIFGRKRITHNIVQVDIVQNIERRVTWFVTPDRLSNVRKARKSKMFHM